MNKDDLRKRTKKFALDVIRFVEALPKEADELLAIAVASIRTAKGRSK